MNLDSTVLYLLKQRLLMPFLVMCGREEILSAVQMWRPCTSYWMEEWRRWNLLSNRRVPLKDLNLKANNLIACIARGRKIIIPNGDDSIQVGDSVVIITMTKQIRDLDDILVKR